jgi:hypothetical protein
MIQLPWTANNSGSCELRNAKQKGKSGNKDGKRNNK